MKYKLTPATSSKIPSALTESLCASWKKSIHRCIVSIKEKILGLEQQTSVLKQFYVLEQLKTVSISSPMNLSKCCTNSLAVKGFTGPEILAANSSCQIVAQVPF